MPTLREQMIMEMELRNLAQRTIKDYVEHVARFAKHYNCSPNKLGDKHIREYLHYLLAEKKFSWSYVNVTYCALKFLYKNVLHRPWNIDTIPPPKTGVKLPEILSEEEVACLLKAPTNLKHKMILMVAYSGGLRVSEIVNLKLTDIDSKRMLIRVEQGKGRKDRYTLLSEPLLTELRLYYKRFKPQHYLFEGRIPGKPLSTATPQAVFNQAKTAAGIKKNVRFHTLRHCFATHLMEAGVDIFTIKNLMGHRSIQTTLRYVRVRHEHLQKVVSPLDKLLGD